MISVVSMPTSLASIEMLLVPLTVNSVDGTDTDNSLGAATLTDLKCECVSLVSKLLTKCDFGDGNCNLIDHTTRINMNEHQQKQNHAGGIWLRMRNGLICCVVLVVWIC